MDEKSDGSRTLAQRWNDLLSEEGYRPRLEPIPDEPGRAMIFFKEGGVRRRLVLDEADAVFYNFALGYDLDDGLPGGAVLLEIANALNTELKAVKVTVDLEGRTANFAVEGFGVELPDGAVLARIFAQGRHASDVFFERARAVRKIALA